MKTLLVSLALLSVVYPSRGHSMWTRSCPCQELVDFELTDANRAKDLP